ncbi:hypothetical protein [Sulfurisphaera ohwakuensis]|uniref:hypothetical protein n=1 Tax=Sulfurisphaera ohwakuensis TaxID=69656 RepID=UPI0036F37093
MNKTLGLILSILFIFEIFLFGIPLTTQAALPPIPEGHGIAIYLPQTNGVAFIFNVSNINVSANSNLQNLITYFGTYFTPVIVFNTTTIQFTIPSACFTDIYYAEGAKVLIFLVGVVSTSVTSSQTVSITYLEQFTGNLGVVVNENDVAQTTLTQVPINNLIVYGTTNENLQNYNMNIYNDLSNPSNAKPYYFHEYVYGQVTQSFTVATLTIPAQTTNQLLVFAPFSFVPPNFIPTPEATGFFNPLQINGNLGPGLQSLASTKAYIWGRALINTSIVDPFVSTGTDDLTFQLNYSTPGPLQINLAQLAYIAALPNFPSKFTYLSYQFASNYWSFLGFIEDASNITNLTITINGVTVPAPVSGEIYLPQPDPNYNVLLMAILPLSVAQSMGITKNGTFILEYFNNLTIYYLQNNQIQYKMFINPNAPSTSKSPYALPVYVYSAPAGSTISVTGTFNGVTYTVNIVVGSTPTLVPYVATTTLTATAYEGITASVSGYYTTSPIMSTPPTQVAISGLTQFQAQAQFTKTQATATVTLLTNATLPFNNVGLSNYSFSGVVVTPEYPIINGTIAMQYMGTAQYFTTTTNEFELAILGSELPMAISTYMGLQDLNISEPQYLMEPFSLTLTVPTVPATETGTGPLFVAFSTLPQYTYITLVDFGLWSNETSVVVTAYSVTGGITTVNHGYFYATIIPPQIMTTPITPQSFECYNAPDVTLYDPDAILVPGNPSGSFTYAIGSVIYNGMSEPNAAIIFYGSTVYKVSGEFGSGTFATTSIGTFSYALKTLLTTSQGSLQAYQLTLNGNTISVIGPNGETSAIQLAYYADNNPTVNMYFEQSLFVNNNMDIELAYIAGLNVSYGNMLLSPQNQVGYEEITPTGANYVITNYITFKILASNAPNLYPVNSNTFLTVAPNASFVGASDIYKYISTDYAVFHYFASSKQYKVETSVTVPNITATLYFSSPVTPLYSSIALLYLNESYYGANLPAYLAIGTGGWQQWNAPLYQLLGISATPLLLLKMMYVNVTLPSGVTYTIALTTKNLTTLFISLNAQQLQYCNGTYEYQISIPGLESILHLTLQQLNNSILTVSMYDYVTHETLVASTKLVALKELQLVAAQPGQLFYFLTFKASGISLTASTPWFIAQKMYIEPLLNFTDYQFAHTNPTSLLHLMVTNITVYHNGQVAMIYYNATSGRTIAKNVYGQVVLNASGNLIPQIAETAAGSGIFTGTLSFAVLPNNTLTTLTFNKISVFTNGTLAITLSNGTNVPLGPAGLFVLPFVTINGTTIGYDANVSVTVTDSVSTVTVSTYIMPANITPIRLAPVPTIPPISHAPLSTYYYTSPVVITPTSPVINIYATSVLPYPYEFFILAVVREGVNASVTSPVVYYSYQAVVAKPALGTSAVPYILVAVQMQGILSLPPGSYTVTMYAVPFAVGPAISEYPVNLVFTNVTVEK